MTQAKISAITKDIESMGFAELTKLETNLSISNISDKVKYYLYTTLDNRRLYLRDSFKNNLIVNGDIDDIVGVKNV